jgi:hypothetical protein
MVTNGNAAGNKAQPKEGNSLSGLLAMAAMSSNFASGESRSGWAFFYLTTLQQNIQQ